MFLRHLQLKSKWSHNCETNYNRKTNPRISGWRFVTSKHRNALPHRRDIFYTSQRCGPGSVVGIATGYGLDGPGIESRWGTRFSAPVQTGPGAHPASCTMYTGSLPGVKSGRDVTLIPHPLLVPWSWNSRAIPLLPLWAVRPVQSLSACTRVHFTYLLFTSTIQDFKTTFLLQTSKEKVTYFF